MLSAPAPPIDNTSISASERAETSISVAVSVVSQMWASIVFWMSLTEAPMPIDPERTSPVLEKMFSAMPKPPASAMIVDRSMLWMVTAPSDCTAGSALTPVPPSMNARIVPRIVLPDPAPLKAPPLAMAPPIVNASMVDVEEASK